LVQAERLVRVLLLRVQVLELQAVPEEIVFLIPYTVREAEAVEPAVMEISVEPAERMAAAWITHPLITELLRLPEPESHKITEMVVPAKRSITSLHQKLLQFFPAREEKVSLSMTLLLNLHSMAVAVLADQIQPM
jgi:hypothetical protein